MIDLDELHRRVPIADGHADSLMWNRDLTSFRRRPRRLPAPARGGREDSGVHHRDPRPARDLMGFPLFMLKERWPAEARASEWTRCSFQVDRLEHFCATSSGLAAIAGTKVGLESNG